MGIIIKLLGAMPVKPSKPTKTGQLLYCGATGQLVTGQLDTG